MKMPPLNRSDTLFSTVLLAEVEGCILHSYVHNFCMASAHHTILRWLAPSLWVAIWATLP